MDRIRSAGWLLSAALLLLAAGCAKRVPIEGLEFSPEEKVVLTFHDSSSLTGRIDQDEVVLYRTSELLRRGKIESADEAEIVVRNLVTLTENRSHRYERERMRHFGLYVDEEDSDRLVLNREDVLHVERIVTDKSRTLRQVVFWAFGAGVGLLATRDRNF